MIAESSQLYSVASLSFVELLGTQPAMFYIEGCGQKHYQLTRASYSSRILAHIQ